MNMFAYRLPYGKHRKNDLDTLKFMGEAGVNLICLSPMNTADSLGNPYSDAPLIWRWFDTYDFSSLDMQIDEVLEIHPKAHFLCAVDLNSPIWLSRQLDSDSFQNLTDLSLDEKWKSAVTAYLRAFLDYCEQKYPDRMDGYILVCGRTMEWIEHDFEKSGIRKPSAFKTYCSDRGMKNVSVPSYDEISSAQHGYIRDPEKEKHVIEWTRFHGKLAADLAVHFISEARKRIRPGVKIGMFYGCLLDAYLGIHSDCRRVFENNPPDFQIGAACNSVPDIGSTSGFTATTKMLNRLGIRYLHECDRITSTTNMKMSEFVQIEKNGIWSSWKSPSEDVAGFRREVALCLIENFSFWAFNIWGQSYRSPELRAAIRDLVPIWEKYSGRSSGSTSQILFVVDVESIYHSNGRDWPHQFALGWAIRKNLMRMGLPFDTAGWEDLAETDLSQYRIVIFQNLSVMNPEREALLKKTVCGGKRLIVWASHPGILADGIYNPDSVERICGMPYGEKGYSVRKFDGWTSLYVHDPLLFNEISFIKDIFSHAVLHEYCPESAVRHSKEFLMVHRKKGGMETITLPERVPRVVELFSGRLVAENVISFEDMFETPDTKLYYFGKEIQ